MSSAMPLSSHPSLHFGAAWYPEHWPEERWKEDIQLMRQAGFNVVRLGEFAWSTFEPHQGNFHFDWLVRAIAMLAEAGIAVVLGTPTAAPPVWLVGQHPDLLAVGENGQVVQVGNRCHYCVNSPEYHTAVRRLVNAMVWRFATNSNVIGWQIDNEFNRVCHCPRCQALFQQYLQEKYGSLDILNQRWSTAYWSQTYPAWEHIPLPVGQHNPGLMLEFRRFVTASYARFLRLQIDLLRPRLRPEVWITHNFMRWFDGFDHYALAENLDMASWDWYVGTGHYDYLVGGSAHDLARGYKRKNYWVMEAQPGSVNWGVINNSLDKGEARSLAWHAVAHGADGFLYWQWRSAYGGQEQYHGSLVDQSGQTRPLFEEAAQLGQEFKKISNLLVGSRVRARLAVLNDFDSRWSIEAQKHHAQFDYVTHLLHYYRPLAARNVAVDILSSQADLSGYRLVVVPALLLLDEKCAANLEEFTRLGGRLVLTLRTGMKDVYNALLPQRQPGLLAAIAGVEVEEYYALEQPVPVKANFFEGQASIWAERLKVINDHLTVPMARYGLSNGWLDGQIAISVHSYGSGFVYYVGAYLDPASQQTLMDKLLADANIRPIKTPQGVEVYTRTKPDNTEIYFVINHSRQEQQVFIPWSAYDHLGSREIGRELALNPLDVAVLTRNQQSG